MKQKTPEQLEGEYREKKAEIRADASLSWEAGERKIRELGLKHRRALEEAERSAA